MPRALLKTPSPRFAAGLTSQTSGAPLLELALAQHQGYHRALEQLGFEVTLLAADALSDSCFVEDMAVVAGSLVIASRSPVRSAEQAPVLAALADFAQRSIESPGKLEGGDVLRLGRDWYIGETERTNRDGIDQFRALVEPFGDRVSAVEVSGILHLKTGVSRLDDRTVLALPLLADTFRGLGYEVLEVDPQDWHAANVLAVGPQVLLPAGHPRVVETLARRGFVALEVDLSEFKKQDGGASCLSILLP